MYAFNIIEIYSDLKMLFTVACLMWKEKCEKFRKGRSVEIFIIFANDKKLWLDFNLKRVLTGFVPYDYMFYDKIVYFIKDCIVKLIFFVVLLDKYNLEVISYYN